MDTRTESRRRRAHEKGPRGQAGARMNVAEKYGLPLDVRYCVRCTISNQRPRITFDAEGVCSACRYAEHKAKIDWQSRERELHDLCDRHRRVDGGYDVIVPSSGGKDSGFIAHQLKYRYGMNPLTVTWAPLKATDIGRRNLDAFVDSGFDNLLGEPNGKITRGEGVALVKRFDGEFPKKHFADFLEYCAFTENQFQDIVDDWRPPHIWDGRRLKYPIWEQKS